MRIIFIIISILYFSFGTIFAQIGGESTYQFLNLTSSARVSSLGGKVISIDDNDFNFALYNPSVLKPSMNKTLALNYTPYFANIKYGDAFYTFSYDSITTFSIGMHYLNYGDFIEAESLGTIIGSFTASDYALNAIYSRQLDSNFRIGVTLKPLYSVYEKYSSLGIATDYGIIYTQPNTLFSAALVFRNLGTQLKTYNGKDYELLPFEILIGFSKRLKHAPFRFSIVFQQLQKPDLTYRLKDDIENGFYPSETEKSQSKIDKLVDQMMRHAILGVEFLPTKNFFANISLNYQRRKELQIIDKPGLVGFSWGFGMKINRFSISYGFSKFHLAGSTNNFSICTNLSEFQSKNR